MTSHKTAGVLLAATAAEEAMSMDQVKCSGVNACKGMTECASASNSCKGKNECKGHGWMHMTKEECTAKGGTVMEEKK